MSAFVVNEAHVKALVAYYASRKYSRKTPEEATEIARELMRENIRSVSFRYPQDRPRELPGPIPTPEADMIEFGYAEIAHPSVQDPVAILKMCACLEYQSCETPDYRETKAYDLLNRIRHGAIADLPGYDQAQWDYSGGPIPYGAVVFSKVS